MTSNESGKDAKAAGKPLDDCAPKAAKPAEVQRELSDDEISAVAGGMAKSPGKPPSTA
ncbi:MAG: hypothetical protein ACLQIB_22570 [Isosphaeraceae bacterium]